MCGLICWLGEAACELLVWGVALVEVGVLLCLVYGWRGDFCLVVRGHWYSLRGVAWGRGCLAVVLECQSWVLLGSSPVSTLSAVWCMRRQRRRFLWFVRWSTVSLLCALACCVWFE